MVDIETARKHYNAWLEADLKVSQGLIYKIGSRMLTRANVGEIRRQMDYWGRKVKELEDASLGKNMSRVRRYIPRDL